MHIEQGMSTFDLYLVKNWLRYNKNPCVINRIAWIAKLALKHGCT